MVDKKVFIADDIHPLFLNGLNKEGIFFEYQPNATKEDILAAFKLDYNTLVVRSKLDLTAKILNDMPSLKFIYRAGAGMDNIDIEHAKIKNIQCYNAENANSLAVAEHTLGLLLNLIRNISKAQNELTSGNWLREENRGIELASLTVGIIGLGNIGSELANILQTLGCTVLAYDTEKKENIKGVKLVSLKEIQQKCNVISFHIPLNLNTFHFFNEDFLNSVKTPFILLNTSRGSVVCQKTVMVGLLNGKIIQFGADVLENEKIKTLTNLELTNFDSMMKNSKVIITPHIAGWTIESYKKIAEKLLNKLTNS